MTIHPEASLDECMEEISALEAANARLNKMLDWCDKMEPGIKRRAEIAIED